MPTIPPIYDDTQPAHAAVDLSEVLTPKARSWLVDKFYKSWSWLAALLVGFIPAVLPDLINWGLAHIDVVWAVLPTLDLTTKVLLLSVANALVLVLRPIAQKNMPKDVLPVVSVQIPPVFDLHLNDGQRASVNAAVQVTADGTAVLDDATNAEALARAEFERHARRFQEPRP